MPILSMLVNFLPLDTSSQSVDTPAFSPESSDVVTASDSLDSAIQENGSRSRTQECVKSVNGSAGNAVCEAEADEESLLSPSEMDGDCHPSHASSTDTQSVHSHTSLVAQSVNVSDTVHPLRTCVGQVIG